MIAKQKKDIEQTYREQISIDLLRMAERWRDRGMPGLAATLVLVNEFYSMEMEGYLLAMLSPLHRLMSRMMVGETHVRESNTERPTRAPTSRAGHSRRDVVLGHAAGRRSVLKKIRLPRRRR